MRGRWARRTGPRMRVRNRGGRASPAILALVLAALAVGASASLLAGAATSSSPQPQHYAELILPLWIVEAALVGLVFGGIALFLFVRVAGGGSPIPGRMMVTALVALLVALLILFVIHTVAYPNSTTTGGSSSAGSTGSSPANSTNVTHNGSGLPGGGSFLQLGPSTPPWALFAVVGGIAAVVSVGVTAPIWWRAMRRRTAAGSAIASPEARARVKQAIDEASGALESGGDLRTVVIQLYGSLLLRLGPAVGNVDGATPEEIRASHLVRLGVRPAAAETLTRSFEEARYSSHLVSDVTVQRVTIALKDASEDLDRAP